MFDMADQFGDDLRKIILLGIGAAVATVEKSRDLIDKLVKKGELTIEQGKVLNEELKHNIKETVKENTGSINRIIDDLEKFSKEELAALRKKLARMENEKPEDK
jgi:polyhydroxyalkanoate synthesis regulator phasin